MQLVDPVFGTETDLSTCFVWKQVPVTRNFCVHVFTCNSFSEQADYATAILRAKPVHVRQGAGVATDTAEQDKWKDGCGEDGRPFRTAADSPTGPLDPPSIAAHRIPGGFSTPPTAGDASGTRDNSRERRPLQPLPTARHLFASRYHAA